MEIKMKKVLFFTVVLFASAVFAQAQGTYALPQTVISLEVEAVKETFHAGPYARYARKYLGIDARPSDESRCHVSAVRMVSYAEARRDVVPGWDDTSTRNRALKELFLAGALYRCGDKDGIGRSLLERYAVGLQAHYARYAYEVLQSRR